MFTNTKKVVPLAVKNVQYLKPVEDFVKYNDVFVYYYVHGVLLDKVKDTFASHGLVHSIGTRIALSFFKAIYESKIIFGDMNPGNFLYDFDTNIVTFIDYGCVFELNDTQITTLKSLHKAQQSRHTLRTYLKKWNAPELLADCIYQQSRVFLGKKSKRLYHDFC